MADNYETMNQESPNYGCFKEAVCIDASRVYDSCGDKDCLEDLRVYFSPASQAVIDQAAQVRMRNVDVLVVYLGLEPVPFHKGFYSVDMTFFFEVTLDVFQTPAAPPVTISGLSVFSKTWCFTAAKATSRYSAPTALWMSWSKIPYKACRKQACR